MLTIQTNLDEFNFFFRYRKMSPKRKTAVISLWTFCRPNIIQLLFPYKWTRFLVSLVLFNCHINAFFRANVVVMILNNKLKGGCDDRSDIVAKRTKLLTRRCVSFLGRLALPREKQNHRPKEKEKEINLLLLFFVDLIRSFCKETKTTK